MSNYSKRKEAEALAKKESTKKTVLAIIAVVVVLGVLIGGAIFLKNNRSNGEATGEITATGDPNYNVFDYVTLGQYEGIEVNRIIPEVTDDDFQKARASLLESKIEREDMKDGTVAKGDIVTIDFEGKMNGETFEGGSSTGHTYELGKGSMIEGFDEGIYGMKIGEEKTIDIKFPDSYPNQPDYAGKDVSFTITLKSAERVSYAPEWDDEFAKKDSEGKYSTIEEYEKAFREDLLKQAEETSESTIKNDIWTKVFENATIKGYPKYLYNKLNIELTQKIAEMASQYGTTTENYLKYFCGGMTMKEYVMQYVNSQLVAQAIRETMKLELTDEKFNEMATADLESFGVDSLDALIEKYSKETLEEYYTTELLHDTLLQKAIVKDITKAEYDELNKEETDVKE